MENKKHITFIGLNFYPENTAIGLYSTQLVDFLEKQGYDITVITAFPYYPQWKIAEEYSSKPRYIQEQKGNVKVYRYKQYTPEKPSFFKRVIHILDFSWGSYFNLRKIKHSDIIIAIVPFTSSAWLGGLVKRRLNAKLWVHIQDFEFDAAFQSGIMGSDGKPKGVVYKLLMRLERYIFNKADTVSTISQMMLQSLSRKTTQPQFYLPNWVDENEINPKTAQQHPYLKSEKFKILYSGNIGDKQDWVFFKELLSHIDFNRFELIIVGAGAQYSALKTGVESYSGITLYPPVPYEELSDLLCSADLHFLFQKHEIRDTVMPSKVLGMMASGKPSIITGHPDSEVAKIIRDSKGGIYNNAPNVKEVINQIETLLNDPDMAVHMGKNARQYIARHFAKAPILNNFLNALNQL